MVVQAEKLPYMPMTSVARESIFSVAGETADAEKFFACFALGCNN